MLTPWFWNWFVDRGLIRFDEKKGELSIDYAKYDAVAGALLAEVLELQRAGDKAAAGLFIERWTAWGPMHETVARKLRDAQAYRFTLVRYAALGE